MENNLLIPYKKTTTYTFGSDDKYNELLKDKDKDKRLNDEPLLFLKILKNENDNVNNANTYDYISDPLTVQNFYYHESGKLVNKSIDGIINKTALMDIYDKYYKNLEDNTNKQDLPGTVTQYINNYYDFYEALNTCQRLGEVQNELNAFTKQSGDNYQNPSNQDIFYQMYNDCAEVNNNDSNSSQPFCTRIYRANISVDNINNPITVQKDSFDKYITYIIAPVFFYKLKDSNTANLTCHIECRNIKIPYKVLKIDNYNYMCIMPEYLLKNINSTIYRKLIFNLDGVIMSPNTKEFNIEINRNMLNTNVLVSNSIADDNIASDKIIEGDNEILVPEETLVVS